MIQFFKMCNYSPLLRGIHKLTSYLENKIDEYYIFISQINHDNLNRPRITGVIKQLKNLS